MTKKRILIVEDEEPIRNLFIRILTTQGFDVSGADGYDQGLRALQKSPFDLLITDINLGEKTGLDLLKASQELPYLVCTVMVTGFPSLESAQEALRHGATDYLTKPLLKDDLIRIVDSALKHKALQDEKEQLRANLEAIFQSVEDAIITVDQTFNLLEVNKAADGLCHIQPSEVGAPFSTDHRPCEGACLPLLKAAFESKKKIKNQRISCHKLSRPTQIVRLSASPLINNRGQVAGAVMVVGDETKMVFMEKALQERRRFHRLVGSSRAMHALFSLIEDLADVETTVLITGESGTGKELVAEAIHHQGNRKEKPFIRVNCGALTETLLESELFGHVKGSFTGALKDRMGRFELADKGTLFLDEIGDISPAMQIRLLRVLQEKQFERVGDAQTIQVDVRVVAATNRNLPEAIRQGRFREDLYYRLKVVEIPIPPLRERREDLPLLVEHFIHAFNTTFNKTIKGVSRVVMSCFMNHTWPGNIRELEHAIEHAFVVCRSPIIESNHLPINLQPKEPIPEDLDLLALKKDDEEASIRLALQQTNWRREEAAKLLGMGRSTFFRKIKKYAINQRKTD
ncbi:MAG: sigma 54-interacting transcriptional regulator [Magnetococcales bacterium]|nr:sigma 54-interacting transcriptional regulator [Magnetococcales bacterium]